MVYSAQVASNLFVIQRPGLREAEHARNPHLATARLTPIVRSVLEGSSIGPLMASASGCYRIRFPKKILLESLKGGLAEVDFVEAFEEETLRKTIYLGMAIFSAARDPERARFFLNKIGNGVLQDRFRKALALLFAESGELDVMGDAETVVLQIQNPDLREESLLAVFNFFFAQRYIDFARGAAMRMRKGRVQSENLSRIVTEALRQSLVKIAMQAAQGIRERGPRDLAHQQVVAFCLEKLRIEAAFLETNRIQNPELRARNFEWILDKIVEKGDRIYLALHRMLMLMREAPKEGILTELFSIFLRRGDVNSAKWCVNRMNEGPEKTAASRVLEERQSAAPQE